MDKGRTIGFRDGTNVNYAHVTSSDEGITMLVHILEGYTRKLSAQCSYYETAAANTL